MPKTLRCEFVPAGWRLFALGLQTLCLNCCLKENLFTLVVPSAFNVGCVAVNVAGGSSLCLGLRSAVAAGASYSNAW